MNSIYSSDGARICFRDTGTGLPVVFLHPTPVSGDFWQPLLQRMEGPGRMRALAPDLRGHGGSELGTRLSAGAFAGVPDAPVLSMGQLAADVLALLDHVELTKAVFAGCSIGGYVLLELWRRAPERMLGLAFLCSKPQPDAASNIARRAANIAQARAGNLDALLDGMAQGLVSSGTRARSGQIVDELRAQMTITAEAMVAVQAGLGARPDSVPTVASITAPVLAIAGGEDASVSALEMEAFRAAPGGCAYEVLADAGHAAAYEQPGRVAAIVGEWLLQFA
ncbi:MAG: alpha/beta fold hydrolase [Acidobacteriota bacterium]